MLDGTTDGLPDPSIMRIIPLEEENIHLRAENERLQGAQRPTKRAGASLRGWPTLHYALFAWVNAKSIK